MVMSAMTTNRRGPATGARRLSDRAALGMVWSLLSGHLWLLWAGVSPSWALLVLWVAAGLVLGVCLRARLERLSLRQWLWIFLAAVVFFCAQVQLLVLGW